MRTAEPFESSDMFYGLRFLIPWLVCITGGLLFFYEFIQLNIMNSLNTILASEFHLNAEQLGHISSMYFYANASLVWVAGLLLDRVSTKKLILFSMLCCTLGTFSFGIANHAWELGASRFIIGVGGAFCFLSAMRLASRWLPPSQLALATGLIVTMAMLGGMVAQTPVTLLLKHFGWREMMMMNASLGVVITAAVFFIVRDYPASYHEVVEQQKSDLSELGLLQGLKAVVGRPQNWFAAIYNSFLNLPIFLLGALWGSPYLQQVVGLSPAAAASICGMIFLGTTVGSPLCGLLSDRIQRRKLPMMLGAFASLATVLAILYVPHLNVWSLSALFFLLGFFTSTQIIAYPLVSESNPRMVTASAVSIVSMLNLFGGALFQPIFGWVMDRYWVAGHVAADGARVYTSTAYHHALLILPIVFGVSIVCGFLLKETRCKHQLP